jgi:hypothetical protein
MLTDNNAQEKLALAINDSLALLEKNISQNKELAKEKTSSTNLLDQCIKLCNQHHSQIQKPVRVIHHFGMPSDSTFLTSLETTPNLLILKDICLDNKESTTNSKAPFPTKKNSAQVNNQDSMPQIEPIISQLQETYQQSHQIGQRLLICENYYASQKNSKNVSHLLASLGDHFPVRSLAIIADPTSSYLLCCENLHTPPSLHDFERYCEDILYLIKNNPDLTLIQHDDFVKSPEKVMENICKILELPFSDNFLMLESAFSEQPLSNKIDNAANTLIDSFQKSAIYLKLQSTLGGIKKNSQASIFSPHAYSAYQQLSNTSPKVEQTPFILLDSKSIPRSGLHYMKKTFTEILGNHFSFCEWYQEHGCCKKMPCELTGYAESCKNKGESKLRLIKSHDFNLDDPSFSPLKNLRRIILIRSPLYVLTSWYILEQLNRHQALLSKKGVNIQKIWLLHEPEVLAMAQSIVDKNFITPTNQELTQWLKAKTAYLNNFIKKWVEPQIKNPQPFTNIVHYEHINQFISSTVLELYDHLPPKIQRNIDEYTQSNSNFSARNDPFKTSSDVLTDYLTKNSDAFIAAANQVIIVDSA